LGDLSAIIAQSYTATTKVATNGVDNYNNKRRCPCHIDVVGQRWYLRLGAWWED